MDNIGEVFFLAKTMEHGLVASRPFVPVKYDFIVDNGHSLVRVQVKYTNSKRDTQSSGDVYVCKVANGSSNKRAYTKNDVDFLAIHCQDADAWYIIPIEDAGEKVSMYFYPHRSVIGDFSVGKHEKYFNSWSLLINHRPDNTKS